jgi:hypothetical protein
MLTVVWNPIEFHVLKALPKGRKLNAQYYTIIQMTSGSQSQIGGGRPGQHGQTSYGAFCSWSATYRENVKDYIGLNRMKQAHHSPIRQIWHPRTFSFLVTSKES